MSGYLLSVVLAGVVLITVFRLLRARRLREKYAGIWLGVGAGVFVLAFFPNLAIVVARWIGVETPANLLFSASIVVLLLVVIQLSTETSSLEEETRTLAERWALLSFRIDRLEEGHNQDPSVDGP